MRSVDQTKDNKRIERVITMKNLFKENLDILPHNFITAIIAVLFTAMTFVIVQLLTSQIFGNAQPFDAYTSLFQYVLIIVIAIVLNALLLRRLCATDLGIVITDTRSIVILSLVVTVIFNLVVLVANYLDPKLAAASESVILSLGMGKSLSNDIILVLTITVFAPLWEEIVYRGMAFRAVRDSFSHRLKNIVPTVIAIVVSSLLFMDAHGGGGQTAQLFYLFLLGALLAMSYLMTGSLLTPILIHSLNNSYALISGMLKQNIMLTGNLHPLVIAIGPIVTIAIFLLIQFFYKLTPTSK